MRAAVVLQWCLLALVVLQQLRAHVLHAHPVPPVRAKRVPLGSNHWFSLEMLKSAVDTKIEQNDFFFAQTGAELPSPCWVLLVAE